MGVTIDETGKYIREESAKCSRCIFFHHTRRECRRHAPASGKGWPIVQLSDWCAEFNPEPNTDCRRAGA